MMETCKTNSGANWKIGRWTREEDNLLTAVIKRHGPRKWDRIAEHIEGKTGKSCRLRWKNHLNPKVDKKPFSEEERRRLLELHRKYGNKWSTIVKYFPGRTDNHVKNQYHGLVGSGFMKAAGPSSRTGPHGQCKIGSIGSSNYGNRPKVSVGLQFSNVSCQGNNFRGFAPHFSVMPNRIELMPRFIGGSSSVRDKSEIWLAAHTSNLSTFGPHSFDGVNMANFHPHRKIRLGDSVMSNAKSAAFSGFCSVPQPQQGVGIKNYQFIDFLGVGSSE